MRYEPSMANPGPGSESEPAISLLEKARYGAAKTGVPVDCAASGAAEVIAIATSRTLRGIGHPLYLFGQHTHGVLHDLKEATVDMEPAG